MKLRGLALACALAFPAGALAETDGKALIDAVRFGGADPVRLIEDGADVRAASPDGTTALHWAIYAGDRDLAALLIEKGADVRAANRYGATPLSEAAIQADARLIEMLLDAGAEVDERNSDGQTPLMVVARSNNVDAARLLIARGADVNAIEEWKGQTALMWASAQRQPNMVRLLLDHGADPDVRSHFNNHEREITAEPRYLWRPPGGLSALIYAARQGCVDCVQALVEAGANIDIADPEGATALLTASMNFHFDTVIYLTEQGANVNKWDWRGRNPLYGVIDLNTLPRGGRSDQPSLDDATALEAARALLEAGANPNLQLKLNPGYRHTKDDRGSDSMLHATGATPLLRAAKAFDREAIDLLLEYDALVDLPNDRGMTPLMAAAGLDSRIADTRGVYDTPDVQDRSIAALAALIEAGADVNKTDEHGQTAIYAAAYWGWNDVLSFLAENGARLDVKDNNGNGPLEAAKGEAARGFFTRTTHHAETVALIEDMMGLPSSAPAREEASGESDLSDPA